ncbi:MAG: multiubiquitin domain-containing protein [Erysipelotrichaceae bacterium]|nr:multiubiquitin domain-containing protein [Erysipelotrichaceae bacterium]
MKSINEAEKQILTFENGTTVNNVNAHNHHGHPEHPDHPEHPKHITIIVNGRDVSISKNIRKVTYEDVVVYAFGHYDSSSQIIYTIMYTNGPGQNKKGTLVKGEEVFVKEGMIFNVGCSNKS